MNTHRNRMKCKLRFAASAAMTTLLSVAAMAAPLPSATLKLIPADAHQVISVDYGTARMSASVMALKAQALPENLREFETGLKMIGINPDKDLDNLTFVLVGSEKDGYTLAALASGSFSSKVVLQQPILQKAKSTKYYDVDVYPMPKKPVSPGASPTPTKPLILNMTFLGDKTLLLGEDSALRAVLNTRGGHAAPLDSNREMMDTMLSVDKAPVWSALDQQGTQVMLLAALGNDATKLVSYRSVKYMVLGSRYSMRFDEGVRLDLEIVTQDSSTSTALSSLLKAGVLYRKVTATPQQRVGLENMTVSSDQSELDLQFKADPKKFQSLLRSNFFTAIGGDRNRDVVTSNASLVAKSIR